MNWRPHATCSFAGATVPRLLTKSRAISYTRTEISRKPSREATGMSTSSLRAQIFPTLLPLIHTRLAFVHPLVQPALWAAPKIPVKWDPTDKNAPRAVGASTTPCYPTRIQSRSRGILEAHGPMVRGRGSPGKPGEVSHLGVGSESAIPPHGENLQWHYLQYASQLIF